jgi:hypothetical protein
MKMDVEFSFHTIGAEDTVGKGDTIGAEDTTGKDGVKDDILFKVKEILGVSFYSPYEIKNTRHGFVVRMSLDSELCNSLREKFEKNVPGYFYGIKWQGNPL